MRGDKALLISYPMQTPFEKVSWHQHVLSLIEHDLAIYDFNSQGKKDNLVLVCVAPQYKSYTVQVSGLENRSVGIHGARIWI